MNERATAGRVWSSRQRLSASLRGEAVDRTPISFWRHFPSEDGEPERLADALVSFQKAYELDLVKLMPSGMYSVVDYGVEVGPPDPETGARQAVHSPITAPRDWERLPSLEPEGGSLGNELSVAREVRRRIDERIPVIETLFSPLTMATKVAGRRLSEVAGDDRGYLHAALHRFSEDTVRFGRASLAAGVDGFFFATQWANEGMLAAEDVQELGVVYDLEVLRELRSQCDLVMLHLHGERPLFNLANEYPVDWVNWEDCETPPSLSEALVSTRRGLAGGITRASAILSSEAASAVRMMRSAMAVCGGSRLLLAPGCVLPQSTSPEVLLAMRSAVDGHAGVSDSPSQAGQGPQTA